MNDIYIMQRLDAQSWCIQCVFDELRGVILVRWLDYFVYWATLHVVQKDKQPLIPVKDFLYIHDIGALERLQ